MPFYVINLPHCGGGERPCRGNLITQQTIIKLLHCGLKGLTSLMSVNRRTFNLKSSYKVTRLLSDSLLKGCERRNTDAVM